MKLKIFLIALFLCSLTTASEPIKRVTKLVEREGIWYQPFSDIPYTGRLENWYESGQLMSKENFINGRQEALVESWHKNGQPDKKINYIDGQKDGLHESWWDNGQLESKINFIKGKRTGLGEWWTKNGKLKKRGIYLNGKEEGMFYYWWEFEQKKDLVCFKAGRKVDITYCKENQ
jgi:antitoxin component YwqK of YwqJK toxin-antitoxin module